MQTNADIATAAPLGTQLSFDVGGVRPDRSLMRLSGSLLMRQELQKGAEVHVQISDADGQVVCDGYGRISALSFRDKLDGDGAPAGCERIHTAKIATFALQGDGEDYGH